MTQPRHSVFAAILASGLLWSCAQGPTPLPGDAIDREVFIEAYVELRAAAVRAPDLRIPDEGRDEILARHGVSEQDLLSFAQAHGRDLEYMRDVWNEVEARLDSLETSEGPA